MGKKILEKLNSLEKKLFSHINNNENINNNDNETDVKPVKAKQCMIKYYKSEAVKRAKAKYYQKKKQDEEYMQESKICEKGL